MSKHRSGKTASEWQRLVRAWRRGGRTAAEFALEHDVSPRALAWWRTHLARAATPTEDRGDSEPLALLPVVVDSLPAPSHGARWEVALPSGVVVRVFAPLGAAELDALVRALGATS